ncbi:lecithin retinol acyltransferase family protein [Vibrio fluvialis]|nr:lecithin retinol acyltransferase family protein [Vibrio fluvialis]ELW1731596.1 lecithin retinol acyltransferase family protein [Vibrio fluvialis]
MEVKNLKAGDVIVSNFGMYQHWALVSDSLCDQGFPMLISATKRNGTVREETWEIVTQGKRTYQAEVRYERPVSEVINLARSQIGKWSYSLTDRNCEHFIKWATGLKISSTQIVAGTTGIILGASLVGLISEKPKFANFLGGALALGGLAVLATKAVEKK